MRPVVHPPSTMRSKRLPDPERWKLVAQVCRIWCAQRSRIPVRAFRRSKSLRTALPVSAFPCRSVKSGASSSVSPVRWSAMYASSALTASMGMVTSRAWTDLLVVART